MMFAVRYCVARLSTALVVVVLAAIMGIAAPSARGDDDGHRHDKHQDEQRHSGTRDGHNETHEDRHDQDEVRGAVERGELKSLAEILTAIKGTLPGKVIGVEIERKNKHWLYEFRVINENGRLYEVYVDGLTAEIIKIKRK